MCTSTTKFPCENNWLNQQDFIQMVNEMWQQQPTTTSPEKLHHKMVQTRKAIIKWKKQKGNAWQKQLQLCNECLQWLDVQAEQRPLNDIEKLVRILMKERFQQLAMLEEQRWKQRAKRNWVKMGDKNTRYFHQITSHQKRKNHIDMIKEDGTIHYEHKEKYDILHRHFCRMMGTEHQRTTEFDCTHFFTSQEVHMRNIQGDFTK
jgi:hypothetical protein